MPLDARSWSQAFATRLSAETDLARAMRKASLQGDLRTWTARLTELVVGAFHHLGLEAAAKGHRATFLPVRREEYLSLDVTAFPSTGAGWQFPVAACELENAKRDEVVAYSLWKVLCVRRALRMVFCYRSARSDAPPLVSKLADTVVAALPVRERVALAGDTLLFVGSREESGTFPYGFFQAWRLNRNTGRFESFTWQ